MNPTDRSTNPIPTSNEITRRSFMKKTALTAGAVMILSKGTGMANPPSSGSIPLDSPWTEYEYVNTTPITVVGTGITVEAAQADFDAKCDAANVNNTGKSKIIDTATKVDVSLMTHVYKVEKSQAAPPLGSPPPAPFPQPTPVPPPGTGYSISATFNNGDSFHGVPGTRFRVIKWE